MANVFLRGRLTEKMARTLPAGDHTDGQGLILRVQKSGSRSWIHRIVIQGKRRDSGLGGFPMVPLSEAREIAIERRRIARKGGDPRVKPVSVPAFADVARKVHAEQSPALKNKTDRENWMKTMIRHVFPALADRPVDQITMSEIKNGVLLPIWHDKPSVAKQIRQRLIQIFDWVIVEGFRNDNPVRLLDRAMPKIGNGQSEHHPYLPHSDVAKAIHTIRATSKKAPVKLAMEFLILNAVRSNEVRRAEWKEIDLDARVWTIPGEKMKNRKMHRVPLSDSAIAVLEQARELRNTAVNEQSGLVFPDRGKMIGNSTLRVLITECFGDKATPHGFRTSFRTWCQECTDVPEEVAETAIAHGKDDQVKAAYARSDLFDRRRALMQQWADYLKAG